MKNVEDFTSEYCILKDMYLYTIQHLDQDICFLNENGTIHRDTKEKIVLSVNRRKDEIKEYYEEQVKALSQECLSETGKKLIIR